MHIQDCIQCAKPAQHNTYVRRMHPSNYNAHKLNDPRILTNPDWVSVTYCEKCARTVMTAIDSPDQPADPASKLTCVFASWRCSPRFRMRLPHQTYTKAMSPADYDDPRAPQLLDRPAWVRVTDCMVWPHSVYTAADDPMA